MAMAGNDFSCWNQGLTWKKLGELGGRLRKLPVSFLERAWKVGKEDPRRIIHSLKVGLALTIVSLLFFMEPLFDGVGQSGIWAVMTVVVVLEFTAGATLCKGVNRGIGTICAASLAFIIEYISEETGATFRAIFIGTSVFLIGAGATYLRFFPKIKKNYDYGVVIFILTFNLITISSIRVDNVFQLAYQRLYTIGIGVGLCLITTLFIFPIWAGEDLHISLAAKLESLARSIEGCVNEYFQGPDIRPVGEESSKDPIYDGYRVVLDSKSTDEALALFASWEPRYAIRCYKYPGQQYLQLGAVLRHFGYTAMALHGCLESEIQTPLSVRALFLDPCKRVTGEVTKVLIELANGIRNRRRCSSHVLTDQLHKALQDLNSALKSQPRLFLGNNHVPAHSMDSFAAAGNVMADQKPDKDAMVLLPSLKTDASAMMEWQSRSRRLADQQSRDPERKVLRPTLSKIVMTSLEFAEALPFAAFVALMVEMVARLELVILEVEELGRMAFFKNCQGNQECHITVSTSQDSETTSAKLESHFVSATVE